MAGCALIADDLTGALDAGAPFVRAGLRAALPFSGHPQDVPQADVILLNTATREAPVARAAAVTREAAERLQQAGIGRAYKKIDSVLRGSPGAELAAVLDVFGGRALVAPAFPAQGRTTIGGVQYAHGMPVALEEGVLSRALGPAAGRSDVRDAATDGDLERVAREAGAAFRVWCGSAGLAAYVPAAWGLTPASGGPPPLPAVDRVCVIAGSAHEATRAQLDVLRASGWRSCPLHPRQAPEEAARAAGAAVVDGANVVVFLDAPVSEPAERLLAHLEGFARTLPAAPGLGLILTGGETALAVCRALGGRSIEVCGEALPGIPLGLLHRPGGDIAIATKSGGFGGPDALRRTAGALRGCPAP